MQYGAMWFATDLTVPPGPLAADLEARGYESLWVTEHTHIPVSRRTPWPGGDELPEHYKRTLDPFVALTAAAVATSTLRVGTGICLVAQHHPITLAKAVASLDLVSAGRLLFGIGVGWNREEMEHHGVEPSHRRAQAREHVLAARELWTHEEATFDGEFVRFEPSWSWPKPVQQPHPPIHVGGAGRPVTFDHVIEYADGWMPIHGRSDIVAELAELHQRAEAAGRDPDSIEISVMGCPADPAVLERYAEAGVTRCVLGIPSAPSDIVERILDRHQEVVDASTKRSAPSDR